MKNMYVIGGLGLSTSGGMPSARVQDVHGYLRLRHDQWGLSTESGHWPTQCAPREGRLFSGQRWGMGPELVWKGMARASPDPRDAFQSLRYPKASPGSTQDLRYIRTSRQLVWYVAQSL